MFLLLRCKDSVRSSQRPFIRFRFDFLISRKIQYKNATCRVGNQTVDFKPPIYWYIGTKCKISQMAAQTVFLVITEATIFKKKKNVFQFFVSSFLGLFFAYNLVASLSFR